MAHGISLGDYDGTGEFAELRCPACGGEFIHQTRVEVFRRKEDAKRGLHVVIDGEHEATSDQSDRLDGNPSQRRGGITIHFRCEDCDAEPILSIAQHKGQELIKFSWSK